MIDAQEANKHEDELLREKTMLVLAMEMQDILDTYRTNGTYSKEAIEGLEHRLQMASLLWPKYWWSFAKMRAFLYTYKQRVVLDAPVTERVLLWITALGTAATALHVYLAFS